MIRKMAAFFIALMFIAQVCAAQPVRNASPSTVRNEGKTTFGNIAVTGLDVAGNPGYIEMTAVSTVSGAPEATNFSYIIWVDETGDLCIASHPKISTYASYPSGTWDAKDLGDSCTKVGGQS